jgi:hypothetical protein
MNNSVFYAWKPEYQKNLHEFCLTDQNLDAANQDMSQCDPKQEISIVKAYYGLSNSTNAQASQRKGKLSI